MPSFSAKSLSILAEVERPLQFVCYAAIKKIDFAVICGYRGKAEQEAAFAAGNSKVKFPNSKHNKSPSQAVDLFPAPYKWDDIAAFEKLGEVMKECAQELGVTIRWGGDFLSLKDYPHFEIIK